MDQYSYTLMSNFRKRHRREIGSLVCDVGSYDIDKTYRLMFARQKYVGIDIAPGPNVDVVVEPYNFPFKDETFDTVVSASTMEHVVDIYRWGFELKRILKRGGLMCIVAPSQFQHHPHPVDCWRIYPEGMRFFLGELLGLEVFKARKVGNERINKVICIGVARKNDASVCN